MRNLMTCLLCVLAFNVEAAVTVKDAWVRGTVPGQSTTGAFATLESSEDAALVGIESPAAKQAQIHASDMKDGIMHMPTGQGGHPLSPFYANSHEAWVNGEPTPFLPGPTEHSLTFAPPARR